MLTKYIVKTWWLLLVFGAALIALGLFTLINPFYALMKLVAYAGAVLFLDGMLLVILSAKLTNKTEKNLLAAESAVNFFFAVLLCFNPLLTLIALQLIMGGWLITTGTVKLLASLVLRKYMPGWLYISAAGIIAILFGFLVIYNPSDKASGTLVLYGIFFLLMGLFYIIDALRFKNEAISLSILL